MDKHNIDLFASNYPKGVPLQSKIPQKARTQLSKVLNKSQPVSAKVKKLLAILLIAAFGAFIYSIIAYTISEDLFGKFGFSLVTKDGLPKMTLIIIHTVIFICYLYLVFKLFKL